MIPEAGKKLGREGNATIGEAAESTAEIQNFARSFAEVAKVGSTDQRENNFSCATFEDVRSFFIPLLLSTFQIETLT